MKVVDKTIIIKTAIMVAVVFFIILALLDIGKARRDY
jgi:hypothetical protein